MKLWVSGFILLLFVLLGGGIFLARIHNTSGLSAKEKQQALENMLGRSPILQEKTPDNSLKTFRGQSLAIQYPASAKIYSSSANSQQDIFSFGILGDHILVSTGVFITSNKLSEYGGVVLRHMQKDVYSENTKTFLGLDCITFLKTTDGVEQSLFCEKEGKVLSFVVTGPDTETVGQYFTRFSQSMSF